MVTLDVLHRYRTVKILEDEDDIERAADSLRMRYMFRVDGKPISPAQEV